MPCEPCPTCSFRRTPASIPQDAYTVSRTMAGEHMIGALEERLGKVRSTSAELESVGAFYTRIIGLCLGNPPKDNRHLKALEEQVRIVGESSRAGAGRSLRRKRPYPGGG